MDIVKTVMKEYKQKWLVFDEEGWQVVMPDFDLLPHSKTAKKKGKNNLAWLDCPCKPKIDALNQIIVHNSFQDIERINKSMKRYETK